MAKKFKGFGEPPKPKGPKQVKGKPKLGDLQNKIEETLGREVTLVTSNHKAAMSEVILDFLAPYAEYAQTHDEQKKLVSLGIVAWNIALMPEDDHKQEIDAWVREVFPDKNRHRQAQRAMQDTMNDLVAHKLQYFADSQHYIVGFDLKNTSQGLDLSIASTLPE
jgi:hypothetical protein